MLLFLFFLKSGFYKVPLPLPSLTSAAHPHRTTGRPTDFISSKTGSTSGFPTAPVQVESASASSGRASTTGVVCCIPIQAADHCPNLAPLCTPLGVGFWSTNNRSRKNNWVSPGAEHLDDSSKGLCLFRAKARSSTTPPPPPDFVTGGALAKWICVTLGHPSCGLDYHGIGRWI